MDAFLEALTQFFVDWGYWGLFLSAFIAGSIIPFSSEVVLVILVKMGLDPILCLLAASTGNTLGGMTCFWIGQFGKKEWITKLGIKDAQLAKAQKFLKGRGALMGFFAFLPYIGEAIALALGLMRSNTILTCTSMFIGKLARYVLIFFSIEGLVSLFT